MILGIGIDIEEASRFNKLTKAFIKTTFSDAEIAYCLSRGSPPLSFAGKFCAKEAVIKASSEKLSVKDIEILVQKEKTKVYIKGLYQKNICCSISHSNKNIIAIAIIEGTN